MPVLKNYFGVHHGKSSCDACIGRVKQGVTRLVKSGTEVVNSARSFYECCVKHLQKPLLKACQHYILTFEFHNKLSSRPDTKNGLVFQKRENFIALAIRKIMICISVLSHVVYMALKIAQTQYAQKNGMGIIYLGKRIVNLVDCGGAELQMNRFVK